MTFFNLLILEINFIILNYKLIIFQINFFNNCKEKLTRLFNYFYFIIFLKIKHMKKSYTYDILVL